MSETMVSRSVLAEALKRVVRAAATRTSVPILECVTLDVTEDKMRLSATNLSIGISTAVSVDTDSVWSAAVPAHRLSEIVSSMTAPMVELDYDAKKARLTARTASSRVSLASLEANDFPTLPGPLQGHLWGNALANELRAAVEAVRYAALPTSNQSNPSLHHINLVPQKGELVVVAADGFQLGVARLPFRLEDYQPDRPILPFAGDLDQAVGVIDSSGETTFWLADGLATLLLDDGITQVSLRLAHHTYPDVLPMIKMADPVAVTIEKATFLGATNHLMALRNRTDVFECLAKLTTGNNRLILTMARSQVGDGEVTMVADGEDEITVNINIEYMKNALTALDGKSVRLEIARDHRMLIVSSADGASTSRHLMMCAIQEEKRAS